MAVTPTSHDKNRRDQKAQQSAVHKNKDKQNNEIPRNRQRGYQK